MKIAEKLVLRVIKWHNSENKNFTDKKTKIMMTIMMIRNEQGVYKNMATENGVKNTSCTMHNAYYTKQLT